jgi:multidrug resistance efflux pump
MRAKRVGMLIGLAAVAGATWYYTVRARAGDLVLTGIVTTNEVVVSPQISGRIGRLLVNEGDTVAAGQLLAVIAPDELRAETSYYSHSTAGLSSQVREARAALRYQTEQTAGQIRQAEATLGSIGAQVTQAEADLESARLTLERSRALSREGVTTAQQHDEARTTYDAATARVEALKGQVEAQRAAVSLARASAEQIAVRQSQLQANEQQLAAAAAQQTKADVRLAYTEMHAPIDGLVDVRAVRPGEFVNAGQPVLTLVNPDDLWIRADVEETYVDGIGLGTRLTVRLPSGVERQGTVFWRGVDAGFATQRDVSRTKRDVKTFEVRLRVDNRDRRLAVGMTAYVLLPVSR